MQRLAIIGCGGMEVAHEEAFGKLRDRVRVVGTADVVLERAERAAATLGADVAVTDYRDLLDAVDAVLIATPHDLHFEMGRTSLLAGKHVLMEKPLANSERECLELIALAAAEQRVLMTAYPMRFHPLVVRLKQALDSQEFGEVFHVSMWTEQHTEFPPGHWTRDVERLGGGQFFSHGCHYVDLLLWMLGRPVRGHHLGTRVGTPWMPREGTSDAAIEFESGALGYHFGTWGARGTRLGYAMHAHCTRGMVEADITGGVLSAHTPDGVQTLLTFDAGSKNLSGELEHFVECVESGTPPLTDGAGSVQGLRVIWRMYEAERAGVVADLSGLGLDEPWEAEGLDRLPVAHSEPAQGTR
jgi:predicted dehydrogenase